MIRPSTMFVLRLVTMLCDLAFEMRFGLGDANRSYRRHLEAMPACQISWGSRFDGLLEAASRF